MTLTPQVLAERSVPRPFQQFFRTEAAGGAMLLVAAVLALAIANSPWAEAYERLWHLPISIAAAGHGLSLTLRQWINDALMAVFFLLVGLEIKRECVAGELAAPRLAALPIAAAVGGMVVPAAIFGAFTFGRPAADGWAIPMATDIAFALGTLSLVAPQAQLSAKVFLSALAIVDDLGAVVVIAFFYSQALSWSALAGVAAILMVLVGMNRAGVRRLSLYLVLGVALWWFVHESGLHATVAGVLLAMTIPTRSRINAAQFSTEVRGLVDEFDRAETGDYLVLTSKGQQEALFAIERASEGVAEPLLRLEHPLHTISAFAVMPLFALANAGVAMTVSVPDPGLAAGTILGLTIGKPVGITLAAWLVVRSGWADLPRGMSWLTLHACGWLGGIGFTMSLFVATLAFAGTPLLDAAKTAVMAGSLIAGGIAAALLRRDRLEYRPSDDAAV